MNIPKSKSDQHQNEISKSINNKNEKMNNNKNNNVKQIVYLKFNFFLILIYVIYFQ